MPEDEKIQELIEKYGGYFENSNADVCHTYKGIWFDPKYKNFECFIQFETAGQLKNIILGEIVTLIEVATDTIAHEYDYKEINEVTYSGDYEESINKLFYNLEVFTKSTHMLEDVLRHCQVFCLKRKRFKDGFKYTIELKYGGAFWLCLFMSGVCF